MLVGLAGARLFFLIGPCRWELHFLAQLNNRGVRMSVPRLRKLAGQRDQLTFPETYRRSCARRE